jgi:serine/threonine protein phosphatase PrpC
MLRESAHSAQASNKRDLLEKRVRVRVRNETKAEVEAMLQYVVYLIFLVVTTTSIAIIMWRKATSSAQSALGRRPTNFRYNICRRVPTVAFALSAAVSIRPVVTLMEAEKGKNCPAYGCPLLPQDVYYEDPVKEALTELRMKKRDEVADEELQGGLESSGRRDMATLTLIGYKGGPLEKQINQDRSFCVAPYIVPGNKGAQDSKIMGVFDGHANLGERVSQYTVTELPKLLAAKLGEIDGDTEQIKKALVSTFIELDKSAPAEISGGCTASVVLQHGSRVYFANAGDSSSFLVVYRAEKQTAEIVYITREDKPSLPDEKERVEKMGGQVYIPVSGTSRVLYVDPETGMQSGLAMSRSIGDWEAGKLGVIPDPLVDVINIPELVEAQMQCTISSDPDGEVFVYNDCDSEKDDVYIFAVSATDGMMDFATPDSVAKTIALSLYDKEGPHLLTALEQLIYMAAQGWEQSKQGRYRDDIAIVVSQLRIPPSTPSQ